MTKVLVILLALAGLLAGDAALCEQGYGELVDFYALADGGNITITLYGKGLPYRLVTRVNHAGGGFQDKTHFLPAHQNGWPTEILTEVCGGRLHVMMSWGKAGGVYGVVWDLPLSEMQLSYLPFVCRATR